MNFKTKLCPLAVFAALVAVGVAGRFLFLATPNFTPTAAVALFAGFYFAGRLTAAWVPLLVMVISNLWLPSYSAPGEMAVIYAAALAPVALGRLLKERATFWRICLAAALPSLIFYLATNFAVWCFTAHYPHSAAGLADCYVRAVPFYRWMLEGDLLFIPLVFGSYLAIRGLAEGRTATTGRGFMRERVGFGGLYRPDFRPYRIPSVPSQMLGRNLALIRCRTRAF